MSATETSKKVAVIGLGAVGHGIAARLVREGWSVVGVNANPAAVARFAEASGTATSSAREAALGVEVVVLVLVNAAQCEAVLFGEADVLSATATNALIVSCVTMNPTDARSLGSRVAASGRAFLDAPTSGGPTRAANGELTILASGPEDAMARAEPIFEAIAAKVYRLGSEAGTGSAFKMINQLLAGVHIAVARERWSLRRNSG